MGAWAQKIQLRSEDALFHGGEASEMLTALVDEAGLSPFAKAWADERVSLDDQAHLAQLLKEEGRTAAALDIAYARDLAAFADAGAMIVSCANLANAVNAMNSVAPLLNLRHYIALGHRGDVVTLTLKGHAGVAPAVLRVLLPLDMAKLARFLRDLLGQEALSFSLHAGGEEGHALRDFAFARGLVHSDCVGEGYIQLDGALARKRLPGACQVAHRLHAKSCRQVMNGEADKRLCESVRRILVSNTKGFPSLGEAAAQLGFSSRTFRRRLAEQGVNFMQIIDQVRCSLALDYLTKSSMTTEAIAEQLGYSESANFRHAFRRWTGSSPRRYCGSMPTGAIRRGAASARSETVTV